MTYLGGQKTSNILSNKGLGTNDLCFLCNTTMETHIPLFFKYPFSMNMSRTLQPNRKFFLLQTSLLQILRASNSLVQKALRNLICLINVVIFYMFWRKRNNWLHL